MAFGIQPAQPAQKKYYSSITVSLSSPETILERSFGEVLKPETINYRSFKPEKDGLFCEKIFGPVKDWECHCGKYKRIRYKGIICDRCGVEVTQKSVRRERFGHITLSVPVVHIWYFKSLPNKIGALLGMKSKDLDKVIYYESYVVVNPGGAVNLGIEQGTLLTENEYFDVLYQIREDNNRLADDDPEKFVAMIGGEAVEELLKRMDLDMLATELRFQARTETSQARKAEALKRLGHRRGLPRRQRAHGEPSRVDGDEGDPGDPAGAPPARAARGRPVRDVGPERPVPARHHPQQPPQAPDRHQGAGGHPPQREADAAGGRRLPVRQLPQGQRRPLATRTAR